MLLLAKYIVLFISYVVPLVLAAPLILLLYQLDNAQLQLLLPSLVLGGALLLLLGLLANALLLGVKHGRFIGVCVLLPLYVPIIVLGAGTERALAQHVTFFDHHMLFVGLLFMLLPITLVVGGACLRAAVIEE